MSFAGLTAVVTGATGGIGAAVALALAAAGATVHGLGRHPAGPAGLAWHRVDLADDAAVAGFAAALGGEGLDILVHGAGLHGGGRSPPPRSPSSSGSGG